MADFGFTNKSNSSDFSSTGDKVNEVFGDLLLNRTELEAMITSLKRRQYGATPPANPNTGDVWECSTTGGGYTAGIVYRYNGSAWAELIASAVNIPNRNTVIQGKVTAAGLPDLFEAGTGLAVKLNATATPAIFAFMNGNSTSLGTVDIVAAVSADAATFWSSLPTSSTVYLYVDYTTGTVSGGFTTVAPVYQSFAPTHSAGLHWLDFNTGKVWSSDGSTWTQRNRIFVGTATTDGSGVTAVNVYAYNQMQKLTVSDIVAEDVITKGPWVDVRAYMTGETDITVGLLAAEAALPETGGVILVPQNYDIETACVLTKKITLTGLNYGHNTGSANYGASTLVKKGAFDAITLTGAGSRVQQLQVSGGGYAGDGIVILASRIKLDHCSVSEHGGNGIRIGSDTFVRDCPLWSLINVTSIANGKSGLYVSNKNGSTLSANGGLLVGGDYRANVEDGIRLEFTANNAFLSPACQNNGVRSGSAGSYTYSGTQIRLKSGAIGNWLFAPYAEGTYGTDNPDITFESGAIRNFAVGYRAGLAYSGYSDANADNRNTIMEYNTYGELFWKTGTSTKNIKIKNPDVTGQWLIEMLANRDLSFTLTDTSSTGGFIFAGPITVNSTQKLSGILTKSATLNFPSIPAHTTAELTLAVTGATVGQAVFAYPNGTPESGLMWSAFVSTADTVTVRMANITAAAIDPASLGWRCTVLQHAY